MSKNIKITKNTISLMIREALNKGALFILLVLIGRVLGKEALGRYSFAIAISQIFFFGTELGINTLVVREVAKEKALAGKFLVNMLALRGVAGLLTLGLIWLSALVLKAGGETATAIYLCALSYFFVNITNLYTSVFRAFEKMELELLVTAAKTLLFLPVASWFVLNNGGVADVFVVFLASNILALIIAKIIFIVKIGMPEWRYDLGFIKNQVRQTFPLWVSQLFGIAYLKAAPLLLFRLQGEAAVGLYTAGFVIVDGLWVAAGCFVCSVFPVIAHAAAFSLGEAKREYLKGLKAIFFFFAAVSAIFSMFAPQAARLFYGEKLMEVAPLFRILAVASVLVALDTHNSLAIIAIGKQKILSFINGAGLFLNLGLNLFLIPRFSYIGSAYALVISEAVVFVLMMSLMRRFFWTKRI